MARATRRRGTSLHDLATHAEWHKVAEDKYTRYVADYIGYMIEVWYYPDGLDKGNAYWRVSHRSLPIPVSGHEAGESRAKGAAVYKVMDLLGGTTTSV